MFASDLLDQINVMCFGRFSFSLHGSISVFSDGGKYRTTKDEDDCRCQCLPHLDTFREDLNICVDDIHGKSYICISYSLSKRLWGFWKKTVGTQVSSQSVGPYGIWIKIILISIILILKIYCRNKDVYLLYSFFLQCSVDHSIHPYFFFLKEK